MNLKIVIPAYNSFNWIKRTLNSVAMQTHHNYEVCVIDDASTQQEQKAYIQSFCATHGWRSILRSSNQGALANIVDGIDSLSPSDEDAILLLDGDDWLYNKHVFATIAREYASPAVLLTYGQFVTYPRWQLGFCQPMKELLLAKKNFREHSFIFSHLRTFRYKIWKAIEPNQLQDSSGKYYKTAWDLAIMYPLLELTAGQGCKFMEEILYVYNMDNPLNDCIAHRELQAATAREILHKEPQTQQFFSIPIPHNPEKSVWIKNQWSTLYKKMITPAVYRLAIRKLFKKLQIIR